MPDMGTRHPTWEPYTMTDPTPDPAPDPTPDPTPDPAPAEDPAAELEKWKHFARTHEKAAKANAEAAAKLQAIEDAAKTQAEKDSEARTAAEQRATQAETDLARLKVATSKGLPPELAARLVGSTEAEMAEDADRLLEVMKPITPAATPAPTGKADSGPQGTPKPGQLSRADLQSMSAKDITEARRSGLLGDVLAGTTR
jgi:hypothetical protein